MRSIIIKFDYIFILGADCMKHLFLLLFFFLFIPTVHANGQYWSHLATDINQLIQQATTQYIEGNSKEAKRTIVKAYFGIFEGKKMEAAMRMELGAKYTYLVEKKFSMMRKLITKKVNKDEIIALAKDIQTTMEKDAIKLDAANIPAEVFKVNE